MSKDEIERIRADLAFMRECGQTHIPLPIATVERMVAAMAPQKRAR